MSLDILSQFPSPPVPNLPAMAMAINAVLPQHQQSIMTQPPVSMAMPMPVTAPPVMGMTPNPPTQPPASFITNFPPVQVNIRRFITDNDCVLSSQQTDLLFRWLTSGYQGWWRRFPGLPGSPQSWRWWWLIHRFPRRDRGSVPQHEIIPERVRSPLFIKLLPYESWQIVACLWKHILCVMQTASKNAL